VGHSSPNRWPALQASAPPDLLLSLGNCRVSALNLIGLETGKVGTWESAMGNLSSRPSHEPFGSPQASLIWQVPAYLPYVQTELTEAMIETTEEAIGQRLPEHYLNLLRQQNGGYIRLGLPETPHNVISGIGTRYPYLYSPDWSELEEEVSFSLKGLVPFDGVGHWHLCLDYRSGAVTPSITFVDLEEDTQTAIAKNFQSYLQKLKLTVEEGEFLVVAPEGIEDFTQRLAKVLKVEFEAPNSYEQGYPIYRANVGRSQVPEWIWVSANQVPKGFIREDDDEYEELKDSRPGLAKRYPELPEHSFLLTVTDGVAPSVTGALKNESWELTSLKTALRA